MTYEAWLSYKYFTSRKNGFLAFLHWVSIIGVALGVTALIVVTGIMTGFSRNLKEKIVGYTPHAVVESEFGLRDPERWIKRLQSFEEIEAVGTYVQGNVFLKQNGPSVVQVLRGVDPRREARVTGMKGSLLVGRLEDLTPGRVFIGRELARYAGLKPGDNITVIAPSSGMEEGVWSHTLRVAGIFSTGMIDVDASLLVTDIATASKVLGLPEGVVSGVSIRFRDPELAAVMKPRLQHALGPTVIVKTWIDMNKNLFDAIQLEKLGLFLVLTFIIIVASFNIISTLIVMVTSKTHDIGVLKAMGASSSSIRDIFIRLGLALGVSGVFWGVIFGLAISWVLHTYFPVPEEIYAIDHVPLSLQFKDMAAIVAAALIISFVSALYPSTRAARLTPADALRYE